LIVMVVWLPLVLAYTFRAGGAEDTCAIRFREAQPALLGLARTAAGRRLLSRAFRTCRPLADREEAEGLLPWVRPRDRWLSLLALFPTHTPS
jgi:hypothetical protein